MERFITIETNYPIANGDTVLEAVQVKGSKVMLNVEIGDLASGDTKIELLQSVNGDEDKACLIPGSTQTLSSGQTSHVWNLSNLVAGSFLHVSVTKGTAAAGVITKLNVLSDE